MKVSILVPTYNCAAYLPACLNSCLTQTHKNLEVVVVDDGSTDSTPKVLEYYLKKDSRIKAVRTENQGVGAARNSAFRYSTGAVIMMADADDVQSSDKVSSMLTALKGNDVAYSGYVYCYDDLKPVQYIRAKPWSKEQIIANTGIPGPSLALKRHVLEETPYREDRGTCDSGNDDLALLIDLWNKGYRVGYIEKPTYLYRRRLASLSQQELRVQQSKSIVTNLLTELQ